MSELMDWIVVANSLHCIEYKENELKFQEILVTVILE